jgi:hypothetical protein
MAPLTPFWAQPSHPEIQKVLINKDKEFFTKSISLVDLPPYALFAKFSFPPCTLAEEPTYATVQMGVEKHFNLNSDLVYINHSCEPSVVSALSPSVLNFVFDDLVLGVISVFLGFLRGQLCWNFGCLGRCFGIESHKITRTKTHEKNKLTNSPPKQIFDTSSMSIIAGPKGLKKNQELTFFYPSTEWDMAQGFSCCKHPFSSSFSQALAIPSPSTLALQRQQNTNLPQSVVPQPAVASSAALEQ